MKSPFRYLKNVFIIGSNKIRFGGKFSAGIIQSFSQIRVEVHGDAKIVIGKYNQNRGTLYLVSDGGTLCIGSHVFFNTGCCVSCINSITIGNNVKIGNNVVIVDHDHNVNGILNDTVSKESEFISSSISIGDNSWIGANSVILRGTTIGKNCVIGAGCVIKGNIPDGSKIIQKNH